MTNHRRVVLLVLKVLHRAQPAYNNARILLLHIVGEKTRKDIHTCVWHMSNRLPQKLDTVIERETALLLDIVKDAHNELVEHRRRTFHNIDVPRRHRIKTAGKYRASHPCTSCV